MQQRCSTSPFSWSTSEMQTLESQMLKVSTKIAQIDTAIIHEDVLMNIIPDKHYDSLNGNFPTQSIPMDLKGQCKRQSQIVEWLRLGDFSVENEDAQNMQQNPTEAGEGDIEHIAEALDQLDLEIEEEIDVDEEAVLEEMHRYLEQDYLYYSELRESLHQRYTKEAQADVAFNLDDIDGERDQQATGQWEEQKGARRCEKEWFKFQRQTRYIDYQIC